MEFRLATGVALVTHELRRRSQVVRPGKGRRPLMIRTNELPEGQAQIQFALAVAEAKLQPRPGAEKQPLAVTLRAEPAGQLNLSGAQVLVTLALTLCMVSVFTWAFVRHWLFAP
jgi:hypothetical protein